MQNFPPPNHRLTFSRISTDCILQNDKFLNAFPTHSIHLIVPGEEQLTENFTKKLTSPDNLYFIVKDITFSNLIQSSFITHFVKSGTCWALSHNVNAEEENFATIIPPGKLFLSLDKEISSSLSLEKEYPPGQKKHVKRKRPNKSIYKVDLISPDIFPGKKLYESVKAELNKLDHIKFDILLKWIPEGNICLQSVRTYFENLGHECHTCEPNYSHYPKFSVPTPKVNFELFDIEEAEEILQWVGTQICNVDISEEVDSFISNFKISEPLEILHRLQIGAYEGFYTRNQICDLINEAKTLFETNPKLPFIVLCISGYRDCYISFKKFSSEDKLINIIIPRNLNCWVSSLNVT